MKFNKLKKQYDGKYLSYYIAQYTNSESQIKEYEFVSRNRTLDNESFVLTKAKISEDYSGDTNKITYTVDGSEYVIYEFYYTENDVLVLYDRDDPSKAIIYDVAFQRKRMRFRMIGMIIPAILLIFSLLGLLAV